MHYTTVIPFAPDGSIVGGPYPATVDFNNQPIPPEPPPKIPPSQQQHSQQQTPHDQHPPPTKEYGDPWTWDDEEQDYVRIGKDGVKQLYTEYHRAASTKELKIEASSAAGESQPKTAPKTAVSDSKGTSASTSQGYSWEEPLGDEFQIVAKPKRFFTPGRIFKTIWFEPSPMTNNNNSPSTSGTGTGTGTSSTQPQQQQQPPTWTTQCPAFHGTKPQARFRWFVVVKRRPHYSLCFSITTAAASAAAAAHNAANGVVRPSDYVVLFNAAIQPARPSPTENITREPLAVIIEDPRQFIAPTARLDCGRIYTVEDHLPVAKIGRIHRNDLELLEQYYKESVLQ